MSTFHGKSHLGFLLVGTLGHPVEEFTAFATGTYPRDDEYHVLSVRSVDGVATCWFDGELVELLTNPRRTPVTSVPIPSELRGSTMHGVAVDCHLEPEATMGDPVLDACWFDAAR
jgi:hypothetical protein